MLSAVPMTRVPAMVTKRALPQAPERAKAMATGTHTMGGPMMGTPLLHDQIPLVKGASGILAFNAAEAFVPEAGPCIRCGNCTKACPMGLLPLEMAARIRAGHLEDAAILRIARLAAAARGGQP